MIHTCEKIAKITNRIEIFGCLLFLRFQAMVHEKETSCGINPSLEPCTGCGGFPLDVLFPDPCTCCVGSTGCCFDEQVPTMLLRIKLDLSEPAHFSTSEQNEALAEPSDTRVSDTLCKSNIRFDM